MQNDKKTLIVKKFCYGNNKGACDGKFYPKNIFWNSLLFLFSQKFRTFFYGRVAFFRPNSLYFAGWARDNSFFFLMKLSLFHDIIYRFCILIYFIYRQPRQLYIKRSQNTTHKSVFFSCSCTWIRFQCSHYVCFLAILIWQTDLMKRKTPNFYINILLICVIIK